MSTDIRYSRSKQQQFVPYPRTEEELEAMLTERGIEYNPRLRRKLFRFDGSELLDGSRETCLELASDVRGETGANAPLSLNSTRPHADTAKGKRKENHEMVTTVKFKPHPLAKIFPRMDADVLRELAADVKKHCLQEPIVLFGGLVLDGVHRQEACALSGAKPRYVHFEKLNRAVQEAGPLAYIMSKNLHRGQLNASQRTAVQEGD